MQTLGHICVGWGGLLLSGLISHGISRLIGPIRVSPRTYKRIDALLIVVPAVTVIPWFVLSQWSQRVVIEHTAGPGAWERGVRVIDETGTLSNGTRIGPLWNSLINPGGVILANGIATLPAAVWAFSAGPAMNAGPSIARRGRVEHRHVADSLGVPPKR